MNWPFWRGRTPISSHSWSRVPETPSPCIFRWPGRRSAASTRNTVVRHSSSLAVCFFPLFCFRYDRLVSIDARCGTIRFLDEECSTGRDAPGLIDHLDIAPAMPASRPKKKKKKKRIEPQAEHRVSAYFLVSFHCIMYKYKTNCMIRVRTYYIQGSTEAVAFKLQIFKIITERNVFLQFHIFLIILSTTHLYF